MANEDDRLARDALALSQTLRVRLLFRLPRRLVREHEVHHSMDPNVEFVQNILRVGARLAGGVHQAVDEREQSSRKPEKPAWEKAHAGAQG